MKHTPSLSFRSAFTLVELIVVVSIIALMMGLMAPAFNSIGRSAQLGHSGNQVVNLINQARQNAMAKNVMTALVVATDVSQVEPKQAIILMELAARPDGAALASGDWKPVSNWEVLGRGSVVDKFVSFETDQPQPAFPPIQIGGGAAVTNYQYLLFLPGGNVLGDTGTSQVRLTEGFFTQGASEPVVTSRDASGKPLNTYNITILNATGRTKIDRS